MSIEEMVNSLEEIVGTLPKADSLLTEEERQKKEAEKEDTDQRIEYISNTINELEEKLENEDNYKVEVELPQDPAIVVEQLNQTKQKAFKKNLETQILAIDTAIESINLRIDSIKNQKQEKVNELASMGIPSQPIEEYYSSLENKEKQKLETLKANKQSLEETKNNLTEPIKIESEPVEPLIDYATKQKDIKELNHQKILLTIYKDRENKKTYEFSDELNDIISKISNQQLSNAEISVLLESFIEKLPADYFEKQKATKEQLQTTISDLNGEIIAKNDKIEELESKKNSTETKNNVTRNVISARYEKIIENSNLQQQLNDEISNLNCNIIIQTQRKEQLKKEIEKYNRQLKRRKVFKIFVKEEKTQKINQMHDVSQNVLEQLEKDLENNKKSLQNKEEKSQETTINIQKLNEEISILCSGGELTPELQEEFDDQMELQSEKIEEEIAPIRAEKEDKEAELSRLSIQMDSIIDHETLDKLNGLLSEIKPKEIVKDQEPFDNQDIFDDQDIFEVEEYERAPEEITNQIDKITDNLGKWAKFKLSLIETFTQGKEKRDIKSSKKELKYAEKFYKKLNRDDVKEVIGNITTEIQEKENNKRLQALSKLKELRNSDELKDLIGPEETIEQGMSR